MITEIKKHTQETSLVFVLGKKNYLSEEENSNVYEFASNFIAGTEEFDYLKTGSQFVFFVKESDVKEKLRVAGHKVRTHLNKAATEITIVSKKDYSLFVAEGLALSNYQFLKYFKDAAKKKYALEKINVVGKLEANEISKLNNTIKAVLWARDMVNEPVSFLTATQLATEIKKLGEEANFSVNVLEKNQIESLKMGGLLAVNKGSIEPPTFSILEYKPKNAKNKKPVVLVGKGVVYDTGGLSLKPTAGSMDLMKSECCSSCDRYKSILFDGECKTKSNGSIN